MSLAESTGPQGDSCGAELEHCGARGADDATGHVFIAESPKRGGGPVHATSARRS